MSSRGRSTARNCGARSRTRSSSVASGVLRGGQAAACPARVLCADTSSVHASVIVRSLSSATWSGADGSAPEVIRETLASLSQARPDHGADTVRSLPDPVVADAYDAWALATKDIVERWNESADPLSLAPELPKIIRDAADLIRITPPTGWTR